MNYHHQCNLRLKKNQTVAKVRMEIVKTELQILLQIVTCISKVNTFKVLFGQSMKIYLFVFHGISGESQKIWQVVFVYCRINTAVVFLSPQKVVGDIEIQSSLPSHVYSFCQILTWLMKLILYVYFSNVLDELENRGLSIIFKIVMSPWYIENWAISNLMCSIFARILWNLYHRFISAMFLMLWKISADQIFVMSYAPWKKWL